VGYILLLDLSPDGLRLGLLFGQVGIYLAAVAKHVGDRGVNVGEAQGRERLDDLLGGGAGIERMDDHVEGDARTAHANDAVRVVGQGRRFLCGGQYRRGLHELAGEYGRSAARRSTEEPEDPHAG
jgi:hypothetical protein